MVSVKAGDVVEFALHRHADSESVQSLATGTVIDVDLTAAECVVQLSPLEPVQRLRLVDGGFKVVYEAGEMPRLTPEMVGWEIEVFNAETQQSEPAIIKRVDADLNCALVVFDSGQKEWMDLSATRLKVAGRPSIGSSVVDQAVVESDTSVYGGSGRTMKDGFQPSDRLIPPIKMSIPTLSVPLRPHPSDEEASTRRMSTAFVSMETPSVDSEEFDWYTEGGHVELCDSDGVFHEGAVLCSRSGTHVQLFNERRQFFEVSTTTQTFKVVIHGLLTLKTIPMGQSVDVYSPMTGGFRSGTVLKAAELGRLTPISFPPGKAVEWLDLASQTFKLVFVPPRPHTQEPPASINKPAASYSNREINNVTDSSPGHRSPSRHFRRSALYPHLHLGQRVELFEDDSKQYLKYTVTKVLDVGAHEYFFEPTTRSSSSSSPLKSMQSGAYAPVVGALPRLRCRLPLQSSHWVEYRELLTGQRVDVYDKIGRSVVTGRVMDVAATDAEPSLLVRYKDGRKEWVFLKSSKVKLRLHGHEAGGTESSGAPSPLDDRPRSQLGGFANGLRTVVTEGNGVVDTLGNRNRLADPPTVNPIDLGQLVRFASSETDDGTENGDAVRPSQCPESKSSIIQAPSDLELWAEEVDPTQGIVQYVHVLTGVKQLPRPTWLRRIDASSGRCFAVHTPTDTVVEISAGCSKSSGRSSARGPSSSGRATLPVGPIEAVRAQASFDQPPKSERQ